MPARIPIDSQTHGQRLDKALLLCLPEASLRERRRLIEQGLALVDGSPRPAGYRVRLGQWLEILFPKTSALEDIPAIELAALTMDYAALCKPAGMHSVALAGKPGDSLESRLPSLFPDTPAVLVNRLDQETSGLVIAALHSQAADVYRNHENAGAVWKTYLALVHGVLDRSLTIDKALDTADRRKTRVLDLSCNTPLRQTLVEPLKPGEISLVKAVIHKGARHQIRAHLAWAGFSIVGDELYGKNNTGDLRLHHANIRFPGFEASCSCRWLTE